MLKLQKFIALTSVCIHVIQTFQALGVTTIWQTQKGSHDISWHPTARVGCEPCLTDFSNSFPPYFLYC